MTRLTNNTDVNPKVDADAGMAKTQKARPAAAEKENFGRQANKGILAERIALELNVPRRTAARVLDADLRRVKPLRRVPAKVRLIQVPEPGGPTGG